MRGPLTLQSVRGAWRETRGAALLICVALTALVAALYWPVQHYDIVNFDDTLYLINPSIAQGVSSQGLKWAFTASLASNWHWHPLTSLSFLLERHFFGLNPGVFHTTNVALHAANVVLLFLLLRSMTSATWRSAFVAAIFAFHPLHVESVAWISERKDVLSTLFWLLTTWAYVAWVRHGGRRRYGAMLGLFALGLLAKPMLVTLPFALLLMDFWPLSRIPLNQTTDGTVARSIMSSVRERLWEKMPMFALALISSVITYAVQSEGSVVLRAAPLWFRLANVTHSYLIYLVKFIWPTQLAALYPYPKHLPEWRLAAIVLVTATLVVLWQARRYPYLFFGWFWYAGTLMPVIGIIHVGPQSHADRYMYVPMIGLLVIVAWGAMDLLGRSRGSRMVLGTCAVVMNVTLLVAARIQISYWKDSETLIRRMLDVVPTNESAHYYIGNVLVLEGKQAEAMEHFRRAVQLAPHYAEAWTNLGETLVDQGRYADAANEMREAVSLAPTNVGAHAALGKALLLLGEPTDAVGHLSAAIEGGDGRPATRVNLARALGASGRDVRAIEEFEASIAQAPTDSEAHFYYGLFLHARGDERGAVSRYLRALELDRTSPARNNLAWILSTSRQGALRDGSRALELLHETPLPSDRPDLLDTLGAAYAEAGRFDDAVKTAREAIALAEKAGQGELAGQIRGRLELYERGQPYREPAPATQPLK